MLKLQVQVPLQPALVQPALIASMAWTSELLEKIVKNCSMYSGGKESALDFALFCRKSPCCFKVFVNYFFLIAGQTWLIFTIFHCIFTLSLQSWKKNSQSEDAKRVILFSSRPHPNLCSNMQWPFTMKYTNTVYCTWWDTKPYKRYLNIVSLTQDCKIACGTHLSSVTILLKNWKWSRY